MTHKKNLFKQIEANLELQKLFLKKCDTETGEARERYKSRFFFILDQLRGQYREYLKEEV